MIGLLCSTTQPPQLTASNGQSKPAQREMVLAQKALAVCGRSPAIRSAGGVIDAGGVMRMTGDGLVDKATPACKQGYVDNVTACLRVILTGL